jgi:hypothetical protein
MREIWTRIEAWLQAQVPSLSCLAGGANQRGAHGSSDRAGLAGLIEHAQLGQPLQERYQSLHTGTGNAPSSVVGHFASFF